MVRADKEPLPVYQCVPQEWLPKSHSSADLGYIGFYPPRPDQDEEVLNDNNVKNGLIQVHQVPAETLSAQDTVKSHLASDNAITELEDLMNRIFARKMESVPAIPQHNFKLHSRITLNDTRRQAWFADLANPDVPLHKLGKNVPHGAKGHDLLDLLHTNNVAVPRAVWFLRVFGGNETAGLRNKPNYNPTQYSVEWANIVTSYVKKQLLEIALPMAPRPGLNIKQTFKGVLSDQDTRERWVSRFAYCLSLLRTFYAEGLVDNRTFLVWLVQQVGSCNLAQLGFVARIADEYLDGMLVSRALTRPLVEGCLGRLLEIQTTPAKEYLNGLISSLRNMVLRCFLALPSSFVSPQMWAQHSALLEEIIAEYLNTHCGTYMEQSTQALDQSFLDIFVDVKTRNEAMLFKNLPPRIIGSLSSALSDIKLLNSLFGNTEIESIVRFFDDLYEESAVFARKLDTLLTWSVTPLQYGDHRPYAAACLLRVWRDRAEERAIRRDKESPDDFIHDQLFDWLDASDVAANADALPSVAFLFGQLVKLGLFSYPKYIQRLVARGETGLSFTEEQGSRHRQFLRWIPLTNTSHSLIGQRKATLYGIRARETPEDTNEREIRKEMRALLPELFAGESSSRSYVGNDLPATCPMLFTSPRYEQLRVIQDWLVPIFRKRLMSGGLLSSFGTTSPLLDAYCISVDLMAHCRCYGPILELTLLILERFPPRDLLVAVIQTLRQHIEVWASLNAMREITSALHTVHIHWKSYGVQSRELITFLLELDGGMHLDLGVREQIVADRAIYANALHPPTEAPVLIPVALPEILLLVTDPNLDAPSMLANSLWYKYRSAPDWAWKVWDNTIASLRQIPSMISDVPGRRACSLRYGAFLVHVDQHLPSGLDDQILNWFLGSGRSEVVALSSEAWDVVSVVLLYLSVHGSLATTTILEGLAYPVWRLGASLNKQDLALEVFISAVNDLCTRLLINTECKEDVPPSGFLELQGLLTRRRDVFREPFFASLVENIPNLVLVEQNFHISPELRNASLALRESICSMSVFRLGIYRDLDTVHRAFDKALASKDICEDLHEPLVNALELMLNESSDVKLGSTEGWQLLSTFLSPWKLAATSIQLRFSMRQLGEAMTRPASRDRATKLLDQLTKSVFHRSMNTEEADFVAEMLKGASPVVTIKFVNAGLTRIAEILRRCFEAAPSNPGESGCLVSKAGDVLRLISNMAEPIRKGLSSTTAVLDIRTQDLLIPAIQDCLQANLKDIATDDAGAQIDICQVSETTIFLARLLQFDLGFTGAWTQHTKDLSPNICATLTQLVLNHGSGLALDPVIFYILFDTLCYVLDEYPIDTKATVFDPFRNYPQLDLQNLPEDMPHEYRRQIRTLLPYVSQNLTVVDLACVAEESTSSEVRYAAVQNRPWEWTENLGDRSPHEPKDDKAHDEHLAVRNSASIPLESFAARVTGERIFTLSSKVRDPMVESNLRMLQDNTIGESTFRRDWRETRINPDIATSFAARPKAEKEDDIGTTQVQNAPQSERRSYSRGGSPASSVRSRGSIQPPPSNTSYRQSPLNRFAGSTADEPIDVDGLEVSSSHGKRKAREESVDDDVEVLGGPGSTHPAKRPRAKTAAKTARAKKR